MSEPSSSSDSNLGRANARAHFLGARIDERALDVQKPLASGPLAFAAGSRGHAVVFRFGALVAFDLTPAEESALLARVAAAVSAPFAQPESERLDICVDPDRPERMEAEGQLTLHSLDLGRMQVVAQVLAKSTVLAYYEKQVAAVFERIEGLAAGLRSGRQVAHQKMLLAEIGDALLIQARTVGRAEVSEKPEITWDRPELDRLYERLASEYELRDRDIALSRKLDVIATTVQTTLDLMQHRQAIRVEWYIVALIVAEIALGLYQYLTD
jgi:uncharacterized Rmd1/YagE family protein